METLDRGITYKIGNTTIQFEHKVLNDKTGDWENYTEGVSTEELAAVLLDRMKYVQDSLPCPENDMALSMMQSVVNILSKKTKRKTGVIVTNPYP